MKFSLITKFKLLFGIEPVVPDDGSLVPSKQKNVFRYKAADQRMREASVNVPNMNPFTFAKDQPRVIKQGHQIYWERIEKFGENYVGLTVLKSQNGEILLVLRYATYVLMFDDSKKMILYDKPHYETSVLIHLLSVDDLKPVSVDQLNNFIKNDSESRPMIFFNSPKAQTEVIDLLKNQTQITHNFNESYCQFDELLLVQNVKWLKEIPENLNDTAIIRLLPRKNLVQIIPQNWFNQDEKIDFEYQWITLVGRNVENRQIHGFGIRLGNFILDESGENLVKVAASTFF